MHQNIFAPQERSYGIVALPGIYPNVKKREGYIIAASIAPVATALSLDLNKSSFFFEMQNLIFIKLIEESFREKKRTENICTDAVSNLFSVPEQLNKI